MPRRPKLAPSFIRSRVTPFAPILVIALSLTTAAVAIPAPATASDLPCAGRWDATIVLGSSRQPAWFELSGSPPVPSMSFQPSAGAPEDIDLVVFDEGRLAFSSRAIGEVVGRFDGDRFTGTGRAVGLDTLRVVAVRAPQLPDDAVTWGKPVALFDGRSLAGWTTRWGRDSSWAVVDGVLASRSPGQDDLVTLQHYMNFKLHLQYRLAPMEDSGVHLRGRYEIQLTDRADPAGAKGRSGAVYGRSEPIADAQRGFPDWNTLDVELVGSRLTARLNGTLVQDRVRINGITGDALDSAEGEPGPIMLQGHLGRVEYRDLVITPALP